MSVAVAMLVPSLEAIGLSRLTDVRSWFLSYLARECPHLERLFARCLSLTAEPWSGLSTFWKGSFRFARLLTHGSRPIS